MNIGSVSKKFKALSDLTRLRTILLLLSFDEICSCYFAEFFRFSPSTISRHLALLSDAELIKSRKEGRWIYFSLNKKNKHIENWINLLGSSINDKLVNADQKKMQKILQSGCNSKLKEKTNIQKQRILFLCTGNSCRSQMAEGWTRHLHNEWLEVFSAGVVKHGMNKIAIRVMKEVGIDISKQYSKLLSEIDILNIDIVVTVCSNAHESCPIFPGKTKVVHASFDDPPTLTKTLTNEQAIVRTYRRVRDEMGEFVKNIKQLMIRRD